MAFVYWRTVRFQDTDAAGVVYFASVLSICHEAYEASLAAAGIDLNEFFRSETLALPIVHAEADYFQPMLCGRLYAVEVLPAAIGADKFKIQYRLLGPVAGLATEPEQTQLPDLPQVGRAATVHVCIHPQSKSRQRLSAALCDWLAGGEEVGGGGDGE
ncbi:MAG: acyl-CoA thioesterase [Elainella sp.]